jgi:hypothetical protein
MTANLGNRIVVDYKPGEVFVISKNLSGSYVIETMSPPNQASDQGYEFVIFEGVKVFDRNRLKKTEVTQ